MRILPASSTDTVATSRAHPRAVRQLLLLAGALLAFLLFRLALEDVRVVGHGPPPSTSIRKIREAGW